MRVIELSQNDVDRIAPGSYQKQLLLEGHMPGIMSGKSLKGRALRYNDRYRTSRQNLINRVEQQHGVSTQLVWFGEGTQRKERRVWMDQNQERVKFMVTND